MRELKEGEVFEIKEGDKIRAKVPRHFLYSNYQGDFSLEEGTITVEGEVKYLAGEYVVRKTLTDGGSTGRDAYPDGHHVYAISLDNKHAINFYQSGCFNCMITRNIKVLGEAELQYVYKGKVSK